MSRSTIRVSLVGIVLYALLPVIAGALRVGDIEGPIVYSENFHRGMYSIGFGIAGHGEARSSLTPLLHHRPYFYGLDPDLFSEDEANARFSKLESDGYYEAATKLRRRYAELKVFRKCN